jgi:hypothetical protein
VRLSKTKFPILRSLAEAPTKATDFGVKKHSMKFILAFSFESEFFFI